MQNFQQANTLNPTAVKDFPYDERISSWEMSQLWLIYQANSQIMCILEYFVNIAQDPEIKAILTDTLNTARNQLNSLIPFLNSVGFPIPHGFSEEDVDPNAERLYSDGLMLAFIRSFIEFGLVKLAHSLPLATRPDMGLHQ